MKIRLSKKQKEVIQKMQNGEILHVINGINARCFFARLNVGWNTIYVLEKFNLIERHPGYISLTELGKTVEL